MKLTRYIKYIFLLFVIILFSFFYLNRTKINEKIETKIQNTSNQIEQIKETVLPQPNIHLIQTAFVPQAPEKNWDQPWQDACEEAALLTVDYFYKKQNPSIAQIKNDILSMINFEDKQGWGKDVNVEQMSQIGSKYLNYKTQIINNPTIDQIKTFISQNIPVVVPANGKTLFKENKYFSSGGPYYHSLVILGYNDTKNQFTVHDVGTQHGAYFKYSYSLLMDSIHDFPANGRKEDIQTGDKRVLVLLK